MTTHSLIFRGVPEAHETWRESSLCVQMGTPTEVFYPEQYQPLDELKTAVEGCINACEVRTECLLYGIDNGEKEGWWGGISPRGLRALRKIGIKTAEDLEGVDLGKYTKPRVGRPPRD